MTDHPRDPDPYHFAAMLDDELRRVELGVATPETIVRARQTYADGIAAIKAGHYAGYTWDDAAGSPLQTDENSVRDRLHTDPIARYFYELGRQEALASQSTPKAPRA